MPTLLKLRSSIAGLVLFAALAGLPVLARAQGAPKTSVLLITVDDMSCDSVGAFGGRVAGATPNIDRLAAEGMRLRHGHVTIAVCQPCRATLMTGRYPHRSGAMGFEEIRAGVPTLVEALKESGYYTGLMAKVSHVVPSRKAAWDIVVEARELRRGRDPELFYQHSKAIFRAAREAGKPVFLMANSQDPHRPFAGSDQERNGRRNPEGDAPPAADPYQPDQVSVPGFLPDLSAVRQEMAEYFTSVRRADRTVGRVLQALEEEGLDATTLVIFLSDNGMALPFAKTNCYLASTRTPLIIRWPGRVKPGAVDTRHFVGSIDVAPTVLEALGKPPLAGTDGRSFLPVLRGEPQPDRERVYTHFHRTSAEGSYPMRAVQDRKYGYIFNGWSDGKLVFRNESQAGRTMAAMRRAAATDPAVAERVKFFLYRTPEELYDYEKDPDALRNLAGDLAYAGEVARYRKLLLGHMKATGDPLLPSFEAAIAGKD